MIETIDVTFKIPVPGANTIYMYDEISDTSALSFNKEIQNIHKQLSYFERANVDKITKWYPNFSSSLQTPIIVELNTPGGCVYDGFSISNTISEISRLRPIEIHATGFVASMGIPVLLSVPLEYRSASKNTTFMVHQVSCFMYGKTADVEERLDETKRLQNMLWKYIAENSKITEEQLKDCYEHKKDWFMSAQEALELGLISKIF